MLDGIKLNYIIEDFEAWKTATNINLHFAVNEDSGAIVTKERAFKNIPTSSIYHKGSLQTYLLTITETIKKPLLGKPTSTHLLTINGSLHKNHFSGKNYQPFTWHNLQTQIEFLENSLHLKNKFVKIDNIEFGVNVGLTGAVFPFLKKSLLVHKGKLFNSYQPDKKGICLGYYCQHTQYAVKVYDKALQNNLPNHLMRFELRFTKMEKIKKLGIGYLHDLKNYDKVNNLLGLLLAAWDNILLFDFSENLTKLYTIKKDIEFINKCSNPKFWEMLKEQKSNTTYYDTQKKFKKLLAENGRKRAQQINNLIKTEWQNLFKIRTNCPNGKTSKPYKLTLKVNSQFVRPRFCQTCGKDISNQNGISKFCSAKYVGYVAAHDCRNKDSNKRNNLKNKISRIEARGILFDIKPYLIAK